MPKMSMYDFYVPGRATGSRTGANALSTTELTKRPVGQGKSDRRSRQALVKRYDMDRKSDGDPEDGDDTFVVAEREPLARFRTWWHNTFVGKSSGPISWDPQDQKGSS